MKRIVLYLLPAMIDVLIGVFFFVATVRMAESGASATAVSAIMTLWGVAYMVSCFVISRILNSRIAPFLIAAAGIVMAAGTVAAMIFTSLHAQYLFAPVLAAGAALFFPAFMIFFAQYEADRSGGIARSTAVYTFAWSMGLGAGPFAAGFIWVNFGWRWCYAVNLALCCLTLAGFAWLQKSPAAAPAPAAPGDLESAVNRAGYNFVWLGWVASGMCLLGGAIIRAVFPVSAASLSIPKSDQGITLALMCLGQAIAALLISRSRTWMYRASVVATFGALGFAAILAFGFASSAWAFHAASFLFGIYSGVALIYMIFHALADPACAGKNIGINETIVGVAVIIGPAMGGALADRFGLRSPFITAAVLIAAAAALQWVVHAKKPLRNQG